ncbi:MAG TPA: hypothetical protein VMV46_20840 [Thermoanaerobaculia bacterium]|nr:hypothetical protein [Thermoanaerobaculia bacterium]
MRQTLGRHWKLWLPPLALVVLNLGVLSTYRVLYAGGVGQLRTQVESERQRLERLTAQRTELSELVARGRASRDGIARLYAQTFGTESERFTDWIREVKALAEQSGLAPSSIAYPREDLVDYGLQKRSFDFPVQGSYASLRQFINFLELTDTFVVLEGIQMNESEPQLSISLSLSTLFAESPAPVGGGA